MCEGHCKPPNLLSFCQKLWEMLQFLVNSDVNSGELTTDAIDHERVQLLLAMFALAREV